MAAIESHLARARLVTIAGPAGCGKTRLAAHAAAAGIDGWPDGVWWVGLQSVTDPAAVPAVVADDVGVLVDPVGGPLRSLAAGLHDGRILICLDNCEHVVDAVAALTQVLLTSCPDVSVLATSREPLNVAGEAIWRLPPLRDDEAMELFVERARQVHPSFAVDDELMPALQRICWGLDGIPLAIELAAAWTRSLSLHRIEFGLDDRFALLVRGVRGTAARHQGSIDWSHDLLDPAQQALFRRLAVFAGGFRAEAVRAVCAGRDVRERDVLPHLDSLVDKSLVVVEHGDGGSRFRLLETIRLYAHRKLADAGEVTAVRERLLDHLVELTAGAEPLLERDKDAWRALVEPERDNVRATLDWGLAAEDPDRGRRLAASTAWLWNLQGRGREGLAILRRAMQRQPTARTPLQARLMLGFALVGDTAAPDDLDPIREGLDLAVELGDERLHGRFLTLAAVGAFSNDNDFDTAWQLCDEALLCAETAGDEAGRDWALALRSLILHLRDRHDEACALLASVTERLIDRGERGIAATLLVHHSNSALCTGDLGLAQRLAEGAAKVADPLGDYHRVGTARSHLALLLGIRGDIEGGLDLLRGFLRVVEGAGAEVVVPGMARTLGLLHLWRGDIEESVRWLSPIGRSAEPGHDRSPDPLAMAGLAEALRRGGHAADAAAVLDQASTIARSKGMPGVLADVLDQQAHLTDPDDPATAADLHHQALDLRVDHGLRVAQITSLEALTALMARTGRQAAAVRILATASITRRAIGVPRRPIEEAEHEATIQRLRSLLDDQAYDRAWRDGSRLTLDEATTFVRRTRGRRGRPATGWASLTPTEIEVVELIAEGLSNPDIAAKLFMSRSTVKVHLAHIFAKLRVSNRTELATLAAARMGDRSLRG